MKTKKIFVITLLILVISFFNIQKVKGDTTPTLEKVKYTEYFDDKKINEYKNKSIKELIKEASKISDKSQYDRVCAYRAEQSGFNMYGWGNYYVKTILLYVPAHNSDLPLKTVYIDVNYPDGVGDNYKNHVLIVEFKKLVMYPEYFDMSFGAEYMHWQATGNNYKGKCPTSQYLVKVSHDNIGDFETMYYDEDGTTQYFRNGYKFTPNQPKGGLNSYIHFKLKEKKGYDPVTFEVKEDDGGFGFELPESEEITCDDLITKDVKKQINRILTYVRILVPLMIVAFGMIDFGRAVLGDKEEDMKKAQSRFIKRLIIGVVIFLLPIIINIVLDIANSAWRGTKFNGSNCGL